MAIAIRQITFFDMPDGGVGTGGFGWGYSFDAPTLNNSTIMTFSQIAATGGGTISGVVDSATNAYSSTNHARNTSNGSDFWGFIRQNSQALTKGWSGRVGSGTSTTLQDDSVASRVARGAAAWTTDKWATLPYKNFDSGFTGTVTANNTTGLLTISGMAGTPQPGSEYSVGDYAHVTLSASGDYFGGMAIEVSGAATASLVGGGFDVVSADFTNGQTISVPTHALGSSQVLILACGLNDTDVVNTPSVGPGGVWTDNGTYMQWDQAARMARLESRILASPGTTGAQFVATGNSHYMGMYVALLEAAGVADVLLGAMDM